MAEHDLQFFMRRYEEEAAAAQSADPKKCIHRRLANDYAAVIEAYNKLHSNHG